jgi:hypothetical protein
MPNSDSVWTHDMRTMMYQRLLKQFGPYHEWAGSTRARGHAKGWDCTLYYLAKALSEIARVPITPRAVSCQLRWATTPQAEINSRGDVRNFILNVAVALEVGFLLTTELPVWMTQDGPRHEPVRAATITRRGSRCLPPAA